MSAGAASFCSALLFVTFIVLASAAQRNITAESGQTVTLPCRARNNHSVTVVEWSRADPGEEEHVLVRRIKQRLTEEQHPSFRNRLHLQGRQMKDGDVSLTLKNVTINDTGTYTCRIIQRLKRPLRILSIIYLTVAPPGQTRGLRPREDGGEEDGGEEDGGEEDAGKEDGSAGLLIGPLVFLIVSAVLVVVSGAVTVVVGVCVGVVVMCNECTSRRLYTLSNQ